MRVVRERERGGVFKVLERCERRQEKMESL